MFASGEGKADQISLQASIPPLELAFALSLGINGDTRELILFVNAEAQRFEDCILYLTETSPHVKLRAKVESPSAFQESRIYDLFDVNEPNRVYRAIVLANKSPRRSHVSNVYHGIGSFQPAESTHPLNRCLL